MLSLLGCCPFEPLLREDLLLQLGSVRALRWNSTHTVKRQAREVSEALPSFSSKHSQHLHCLCSWFHIKRFCWSSFPLSCNGPISGGTGVAEGWSEFIWVQEKLGYVCSTRTWCGGLVWRAFVEEHTLKGVRLIYSFPSKILSLWGLPLICFRRSALQEDVWHCGNAKSQLAAARGHPAILY